MKKLRGVKLLLTRGGTNFTYAGRLARGLTAGSESSVLCKTAGFGQFSGTNKATRIRENVKLPLIIIRQR